MLVEICPVEIHWKKLSYRNYLSSGLSFSLQLTEPDIFLMLKNKSSFVHSVEFLVLLLAATQPFNITVH